jgi:hypothetical protein
MRYRRFQEVRVLNGDYFGFSIKTGDIAKITHIEGNQLTLDFNGSKQWVNLSREDNAIEPAETPYDLMMSGKYNVALRNDGSMILLIMGKSYVNIGVRSSTGTHGFYSSLDKNLKNKANDKLTIVKMGTLNTLYRLRDHFKDIEVDRVSWTWERTKTEIEVGDEVIIVRKGACYDTDCDWMIEHGTPKQCVRFAYETTPIEGKAYKVLKIVGHRHMISSNESYSPIYIMAESGIKLK